MPGRGLDDADTQRLLQLLAALPDAMAVVLVEHHLDLVAAAAADTVTVLHQGAVIVTGSHEHVITHPVARAVYPGLVTVLGGDISASH